MSQGSRIFRIKEALGTLKPHCLEVTDDTHLHSTHKSSPSNTESHFTIKISFDIASSSIIAQHRIINNLLKEEFENGLHALSIKIVKKKAIE